MDMYESVAIRELNKRLAVSNEFDLGALIDNRQGVLAASQMIITKKRIRWISLVMLAIIAGGVYQTFKFGLPEKSTKSYVAVGALILVCFFLIRGLFDAFRNASQKKVESVESVGTSTYSISSDFDTGIDSKSYYYIIGEMRFSVNSEKAYDALVDHLRYRAYYLPGSKVLVNIEALEAPQ